VDEIKVRIWRCELLLHCPAGSTQVLQRARREFQSKGTGFEDDRRDIQAKEWCQKSQENGFFPEDSGRKAALQAPGF
jgi:hypothetical protein